MLTTNNLSSLPNLSGCYLFKDQKGIIIYIGKAKSLKKRVSSYFQKPISEYDQKTKVMVEQIDSVDFIVTNTEVEALILENNLIKKHSPKYNVNLKDSKRYAYIILTKEDFPRLLIARKLDEISAEYFGPFISAEKRDYVIETLKRVFKLRTCKKFPKKPCLRYHIGLCNAPCINLISKEDYDLKKIKPIRTILKGDTKDLSEELKKEMISESEKLNYEHSLELRNQIDSIEWLKERQKVERQKEFDEDIINYIIKENKVYLILFNINKGILENMQEFEFNYLQNPESKEDFGESEKQKVSLNTENFLEEFLIQYYSENPIPKEIILPNDIEEVLNVFLNEKKQEKVLITVPSKGEKKQLLDLVYKNIEIAFFGEEEKLEEIKNELNLEEIPRIIECFDISHLTGTAMVGSMVQFRNGKPDKYNYRRFKIKSVDKIDDFAAIKEIVIRRNYRLKLEKSEFPNLIIIDGGKGQLNAAIEGLKTLNLNIPIISIAKEFEEIYTPENKEPIKLEKKNKALQLIQAIRDEAHRFAINYNRLLRKKEIFK